MRSLIVTTSRLSIVILLSWRSDTLELPLESQQSDVDFQIRPALSSPSVRHGPALRPAFSYIVLRRDLNAARNSALKSFGRSHAAKWPPLSTRLTAVGSRLRQFGREYLDSILGHRCAACFDLRVPRSTSDARTAAPIAGAIIPQEVSSRLSGDRNGWRRGIQAKVACRQCHNP